MKPCLVSSRSWTICGRRSERAYENVVNQKPGTQLLGDGGAADEVAPLEDQRPQAGLGEVGAVDEAVVAAADDDGVVGPVGRLASSSSQAVFRSGL